MAVFTAEDLTYYYPGEDKPALDHISLEIGAGEFVLLLGPSGCGKSSLIRCLNGLIPDFYGGRIGGRVLFQGENTGSREERNRLLRQVGIVFQDPEEQLVMTSVEKEIAFGLENLGVAPAEMKRRIAEVVDFLNIGDIKNSSTLMLSGGQKQKVALASTLVMQPKALLLDEPTSQLDPICAEELFNTVKRINEEMGMTIILVEQRLERCFHLADRIIYLEEGRIEKDADPRDFARWAVTNRPDFLPPISKFFASRSKDVPLTVKEGRELLSKINHVKVGPAIGDTIAPFDRKAAAKMAEAKRIWFSYEADKPVLKSLSTVFEKGQFTAILGQNGAGKSTLLKTLNALLKPQRGNVFLDGQDLSKSRAEELSGKVGYLSQNPNDYLFNDTVEEEILFSLKSLGKADDGILEELLDRMDLRDCRKKNPRELSGGQKQRVALASVLASRPEILLIDEPTRGLDIVLKKKLGLLLLELQKQGMTIILVTHDVEFVSEFSQRVLVLFDGEVVADNDKHQVLSKGMFYAGQMNRLFRDYDDRVVTMDEAGRLFEEMTHEAV